MTQQKITPLILAGGGGTRLWPLSRASFPKQFLRLFGGQSLLQETVSRIKDTARFNPPVVICPDAYRFVVDEQLQAIDVSARILLEPAARNTAPAIGLAAAFLHAEKPETVMLIMPSDHLIRDEAAFQESVTTAANVSQMGHLVTFGMTATAPKTGYGYIKRGEEVADSPNTTLVEKFVEKPDASTAEQYLESGEYCWNSGLFMLRASDYLAELQAHAADIHSAVTQTARTAYPDLDFTRFEGSGFENCPAISIDYAVMEKTSKAAMVEANFGWSDIGAWDAVFEQADKDGGSNASVGDVQFHEAQNCFVHSAGRLVVASHLQDTAVIETDDAILVTPMSQAESVKDVVTALKEAKREEATENLLVFRPWGSYRRLAIGEGYQVKEIIVKPKGVLSLQRHQHRAEHWVVVAGMAEVTVGEKVFDLQANQSTYIPLGEMHRLKNPGTEPLILIETQSGDYLGEDDIERFEDNYGRHQETTQNPKATGTDN